MSPRLKCSGAIAIFILTSMSPAIAADGPNASEGPIVFPGPTPGPSRARFDGKQVTLSNSVLSITWQVADSIKLVEIRDRISDATLSFAGDAFTIAPANAKPIRSGDFRLLSKLAIQPLKADAKSIRIADHFAGWQASASLVSADGNIRLDWKAELRDGSNYVRQQFTIRTERSDPPPMELALLNIEAPAAKVAGEVDGSPVTSGDFFFGIEHPMSRAGVDGRRVTCSVGTFVPLKAGQSCTRSTVIGVAAPGQMRRSFLHYIERERVRPYRPFLHYNSWYDIAWGDRKMNEGQCMGVIELFGRELIDKRHVKLDSFVFDDGWDDNKTLWRFHEGFPRGFTPLREAAEKHGAAVGVWLSPWGGYGQAKEQRINFGRAQGFETNRQGFSLAGPKYYARFREVCEEMVEKFDVNYFKFDGIAAGISSGGAAEYAGDVDGLLRLLLDLRRKRPDIFINVTTGTWPSPFWLLYADSIWRNGGDMGFDGPGTKRQQWITYRDMIEYNWIVRRSPLYPINSLMTQGIAQARLGDASALGSDLGEWKQEVRSFFASGTQTQELYITPQLLTAEMWDVLAEAANWSRKNADILADVHWIGGDPKKREPYGFAAWSARGGVVALRNPSDRPAVISVDIAKAFELPTASSQRYRLTIPWKEDAAKAAMAIEGGSAHEFTLAPFEVVVFDAAPLSN